MTDLPTRHTPWLLALASGAVLAAALAGQHLGGLDPCSLCLYQRWPHVAVIVFALAALAAPAGGWARAVLLGLAGMALLFGAGIAAYHVGVEQHWWAGTVACDSGAPLGGGPVTELRARLLDQPVVRCDVAPWSLFGVSLAGFNALLSLALAGFALTAAALTPRRARQPEEPHA